MVGADPVKKNIQGNVIMQKNEVIQKNFKDMKAKRKFCSIMLTNKRLIIYTFGQEIEKGKKVRRRIMNEIDIRSIHRFEYFLEYPRGNGFKKFIGALLIVIFAALAYGNYSGLLQAYVPIVGPYWMYVYGACGFFAFIGLLIFFKNRTTLMLKIKSGLEEKTTLQFFPTKRNEEALKYVAAKIHNE